MLNLLVDTGSSDLWVFSPYVKDAGNHTLYDWTKSPLDVGANWDPSADPDSGHPTFDISYGFPDSRVRGFVVLDDVSVGETPPVLMAVEVATDVSQTIKGISEWDGILGLGFRELNAGSLTCPFYWMRDIDKVKVVPNKADSFMSTLIKKHPPTLPVFTVDLNPQRPHSKPSVEIGKIDRAKANGDLQHAPVNNSTGRWAVDDISFEVNGEALPVRQSMLFGMTYLFTSYTAHYAMTWYSRLTVISPKDTGGSGTISVLPEVAAAYYKGTGAQDVRKKTPFRAAR
ncbi:MAG: hypothetical protein Q9220_001155 [cf. Caloplaca sp. 1 TL-2023]